MTTGPCGSCSCASGGADMVGEAITSKRWSTSCTWRRRRRHEHEEMWLKAGEIDLHLFDYRAQVLHRTHGCRGQALDLSIHCLVAALGHPGHAHAIQAPARARRRQACLAVRAVDVPAFQRPVEHAHVGHVARHRPHMGGDAEQVQALRIGMAGGERRTCLTRMAITPTIRRDGPRRIASIWRTGAPAIRRNRRNASSPVARPGRQPGRR